VYNALIGTPPMLGKSPSATMVNQTRRVLPLLNEVRKAVPADTAAAVARALLKKPEERFASCVEFAEAAIAGLTASVNSDSSANAASTEAPAPATTGNDSTARAESDATSLRRRSRKSAPLLSIGEAIPTGKVSRVKKNGSVDCPNCGKEFRLSEKHAGKTGRCVKCQVRLRIAKNLASISTIPPKDASDFTLAVVSCVAINLYVGKRSPRSAPSLNAAEAAPTDPQVSKIGVSKASFSLDDLDAQPRFNVLRLCLLRTPATNMLRSRNQ
jgi:hypothetical protein